MQNLFTGGSALPSGTKLLALLGLCFKGLLGGALLALPYALLCEKHALAEREALDRELAAESARLAAWAGGRRHNGSRRSAKRSVRARKSA